MTVVGDRDDLATAQVESALPHVTPKRAWAAARTPVLIGATLVVVAVIAALSYGRVRGSPVDPEAARQPGSRALAQLLEDRGIEVTRRARPVNTQDTTLFVPLPDLVDADDLADLTLAPGRDVVIVGASGDVLDAIARKRDLDIETAGTASVEVRRPACTLPAATTAGAAHLGGLQYSAPDAAFRCYAAGGEATLVTYRQNGSRLTFIGTGVPFMNQRLDEEGNAALALALLGDGTRSHVDWVYPRRGELAIPEADSVIDLLPDRLPWAVLQLLIAAVTLAAWRMRRMGPLVPEPLPAVVRAAEAVEGRARLYEAARARDRAAEALRAATRARLIRGLGLGPDARPDAVVAAIAGRTGARTDWVEALLYGAVPPDDDGLVWLLADLDRLSDEVRHA